MASTAAGRARGKGTGRAADTAERESSVEPFRVTPKLARRLAILGALLLVGFAALAMRLWTLQVLAGPEYAARANANQTREIPVPAARGAIVDRHGVALVTSAAVTSVDLYPSALPKRGPVRYRELKALSRITHVPLRTIRRAIREREKFNDTVDPIVVRPDAPPPLVTYLQERASQFPGVSLGQTYVRRYPQGSLAAQLFGIVGQITPQEAKMKEYRDLPLGDAIGQSGIEAAFNSYLQGIDGAARVRVDSFGRRQSRKALVKAATPGQTVQLTIDAGLERAAQNALAYGIQLAHNNGQWAADGGAIVAMDPRTGAILAAASSPTYNPSLFSGPVTQRQLDNAGLGNKTALSHNYPILNRALDAEYPPGSIFKPLTAIAALQEGLVDPYSLQPCTGTYVAPEDRGHHVWHNWDPTVNQGMNLSTAIAYSCDTYFYRLGNSFYLLPPDRGQPEQKWARKFGFGRRSPIEIGPQAPGLLPTINWKHHRYTRKWDPNWQIDRLWKPGDSIQLAIGQGDLTVTPLQMARFYSAIANGGKLVQPHLLQDVLNQNRTIVPTQAAAAARPIPGLSPTTLGPVQAGLFQGTHMPYGTSYGVFGHFPVPIAGKTGTAQKVVSLPGVSIPLLKNQSWWCGYGPFNSPKLVVCAVIENGGYGGDAAAPAAAQVFAQFFNAHAGQLGYIHSD